MRGNRLFLRLAVLAAAACIIPACGSSSGSRLGAGGGATLLSDGFTGAAPDPAEWTANADGGTLIQDGAAGSPAPSIQMTGTSSTQDPIMTSVDTFATPSLTVSVKMAASGTAPLQGSGFITVDDAGNGITASVEWDSATDSLTFTIDTDTVTVAAPAADGAFHTFVFKVDAAGVSTWTMDGGAAALTGSGAWPTGLSTLALSVDMVGGADNDAVFHFDTVKVTSP